MLLSFALLLTPTTPIAPVEPAPIEPKPLAASLYTLEDVDADADKPWTGEVGVGAQLTSGSSSTLTANASVLAVKELEMELITFKANWFFAEQQVENAVGQEVTSITERSWTASGQYDRFFNEKSYGYISVSLINDDIALLNLRSIAGVGAGHVFVKEDEKKFKAEAGFSYVDENYATPVAPAADADDSYVALRLAYTWEQELSENTSWLQTAEAFPSLSFSEFNGTLDSRLRTKVSESMDAELRWIALYNNNAPAGTGSTDSKWLFSLVWKY